MYIQRLQLKNIRCFDELDIKFSIPGDKNDGINIIIGPNMSGKTTLFSSVFWSILGKQIHQNNKHLKIGPVVEVYKRNASSAKLYIKTTYNINNETKHSYLSRDIKKNIVTYKQDDNIGKYYHQKNLWRTTNPNKLPVLVYYPSQHQFAQLPKEILVPFECEDDWTNFNPLEKALSKSNKYQHTMSLYLRYSMMAKKKGDRIHKVEEDKRPFKSSRLKSILEKLLCCQLETGGFIKKQNQEWVVRPTSKIHEVPVHGAALSDGFVSTFSMFVDLFIRLERLPNGVYTKACVFIDEVAGFLHPELQLKILSALRSLFPNVQFILSTHSPFVVASNSQTKLFVIDRLENNSWVRDMTNQTQRWTIEQILTLFGVSSLLPEMQKYEEEFEYLSSKKELTNIEVVRLKKVMQLLGNIDPAFRILSGLKKTPKDIKTLLEQLRD